LAAVAAAWSLPKLSLAQGDLFRQCLVVDSVAAELIAP
jgi:hypothetical protein